MCRQTSNALLSIPSTEQHIESNENIIETITNLIEKNAKPCVKNCFSMVENLFAFFVLQISPHIAQWIINLIHKMYLMVNKHHRTIVTQEKELNDDVLALFLVSILRSVSIGSICSNCSNRFNLENDLLMRETGHNDTRLSNRKTCFRRFLSNGS